MRLSMPDVPPEPDAKAARLQRVTERGLVTFRLDGFQIVPRSFNKTVGIYIQIRCHLNTLVAVVTALLLLLCSRVLVGNL